MLAESRMMIPDCHKRLEASLDDLKGTLVLLSLVLIMHAEQKSLCSNSILV